MNIKISLSCVLLSLWSSFAMGQTLLSQPEDETDKILQQQQPQTAPQTPQPVGESFMPKDAKTDVPTLSLEDLPKHPQYIEPFLNHALVNQQFDLVEKLLPMYRALPNTDPMLIDFAQAAVWRLHGKHKQAADLYSKMLAERPELQAVRLDRAAVLFEDGRIREAKQAFSEAKQQGLPEDVLPKVDTYLNAIQEQQRWRISANLNYVRDDNVNNVSDEPTLTVPQLFGSLALTKAPQNLPQKVSGWEYGVNVEKEHNIGGHHNVVFGASVDGVAYDRSEFNDVTAHVEAGWRWRDRKREVSVLPFGEHRRYGNDAYYNRYGVQTYASQWLNPRWRLNGGASVAWKTYLDGSERKGRDSNASIGFAYLPSAKTYFFGGINGGRDKIEDYAGASSKRVGGYVGWGQQWAGGFSSRISLNRYNERYDGNHYIFSDTRRYDQVFSSILSLSNHRFSWKGITPKLNWRYQRVRSNIDALHSYQKHKVFISLDKSW